MINIFRSGLFEENTYFIEDGEKIIVIDPGKGTFEEIKKFNKDKLLILLTHSHVDHMFDLPHFKGSELYFNETIEFLTNTRTNLSLYFPMGELRIERFRILTKEELPDFEIIKTPGHTPGSVCFLFRNRFLFTGDTLFSNSVGRTDLPGGSEENLVGSLKILRSLLEEKPDLEILPGHGFPSKASWILHQNPYLSNL
ncbi:MBL fold metallo-hydrolase [Kosmotoga pacifica]|uniref:Metallo-beta-lactamase domain-containing protein n=1 Tax=Kosmotoga pacifica TaxID=1330330 RepID=A0A0G2ZD37_9BACT|nr:MBL fold metallo-hydrolase [Kosmotoga pacifica]AKI97464.1 hypothetical protein IX53_06115 [Kosmotoga pacifica]